MRKLIPALLFLIFTLPSFAQSVTIKGIVTDKADGSTLPGVSVLLKNTTTGTVTDIDGYFEILLPNVMPADSVVFSYVGYLTQSFAVTDISGDLNVSMQSNAEILDEIVVVGYGTQKKSDLTGSVSSVRGADITKIPSASPEQALQGKVSGVQVSSVSGEPGVAPIVRIRGVGTLNNASPIFVVDGVILTDISFLSSADINSIEVLKDASATAIYGSRGANGVIIISTKKGNAGGGDYQTINVSAEYSLQHLEKKIDVLDGKEFAEVVNIINPGTYNNIDRVDNTDWQDLIFNDYAPMHNYHASVAGASGKHAYYFGAGYFLQDGIIDKSGYERLSIKLNNEYTLTKFLKLGSDLTFAPETKEIGAEVVSSAYRAWPTSVPYNDDSSFAEVLGSGNPLAAIEYTNNTKRTLRSVGNFYGDVTLLKGLVFRSSYGFDISYDQSKNFTPVFFVSPSQSNDLNDLAIDHYTYKNWLWENTLSYDKTFGDHHLNLLGGITAEKTTIETLHAGIQNLIGEDPSLWYLDAGEINYLVANNGGEITTIESFLGRVNYVFREKYLVTASVRRDGSSKFGVNNKWGTFPSVALGWNISNEKFLSSNKTITNLKLRASYGVIGNEKIPWYRQFSLVDNSINTVFGSDEELNQGATYGVSGNPDLKWESTTQTDAGLEIGLLNDKITAEFDFYNKITDGILVDLLTPGHLGNGSFATETFNAAKVLNRGFEFNLAWNDDIGKLHYRLAALGATVHNEVLALGAEEGSNSFIPSGSLNNGQLVTRTVVGQSIGEYYGYQVIGVFQTADEVASSAIIAGQQPGDLKFADLNGDGIIDDEDRTFIGSYIPDIVYGFSLELLYQKFSFSFDFSGQSGNEIYNGKNAVRPDLYNFEAAVIDHWDGEGSSNTEPRPTAGGSNYEPSDYFIQDGSFLRLRSTTLSYAIGPKIISGSPLKASVYLRGTNLFTFSEYTGYTPEIGSENALASGIDLGVYPITSVYSLGINLNF